MRKQIFRNAHYNIPGHAHDITFSVYRRQDLFLDPEACRMFLCELETAREEFSFRLWAWVVMPNHIHLLIWPLVSEYRIEKINKAIKGRMAKRYISHHRENASIEQLKSYRVVEKRIERYRIWQRGGGFDRNLWNAEPIHKCISYIEANPVRKGLSERPEEYRWSSAYARVNKEGVVPDVFNIPVAMPDARKQRVGGL